MSRRIMYASELYCLYVTWADCIPAVTLTQNKVIFFI